MAGPVFAGDGGEAEIRDFPQGTPSGANTGPYYHVLSRSEKLWTAVGGVVERMRLDWLCNDYPSGSR